MKSIKLLFAALLCVNSFALFAQNPWQPENSKEFWERTELRKFYDNTNQEHPLPDSVRIEFPELQSLVIFNLRDVQKELNYIKFFPEELKIILKEIAKGVSDPSLPQSIHVEITESGAHHIVIKEPRELTTRISTKAGEVRELLPPGWEIEIESRHRPKVYVYGPDLSGLESLSTQSFQLTVDSIAMRTKENSLRRHNLVSNHVVKGGNIIHSDMYERHVSDIVELGISTGFGYVANNFCPNFAIEMNMRFSDRTNVMRHKLGLNVERMFFAEKRLDGNYHSFGNTFLNLSYAVNVGNNENVNWFGFGGGLMVNQKDGFFKGNTAKFFLKSTIGHVTVMPEYYLTNGYKDGLAGFKVGYTF